MSDFHAPNQSIESRIAAALSPEPPAETETTPTDAVESPQDHEVPSQEPVEASSEAGSEEISDETTDATPEEQKASEPTEEEIEEVMIDNLQALAEYMEVDVSDLYGVQIPITSPDGTPATTTLGDLKDGATTAKIAQKARQEAEELRANLERQQQEKAQEFEAQHAALAGYLQQANDVLIRDFNNVNWQQLEQEDPGRFAAMRQQFAERNAELQGAWQNAQQNYMQYQHQQQEAHQQNLAKHLEAEEAALLASVPEWGDVKVRETETGKLRDYLQETGYKSDEIDRAYDHRMLVLARKAMLFDQMSSKAEVAKKKVAKLGKKVLKSGTRQSKGDQAMDRSKQLRAKLRKSGRMEDAVDVIGGMLSS